MAFISLFVFMQSYMLPLPHSEIFLLLLCLLLCCVWYLATLWLAQALDVIFGAMSANAIRCYHKAFYQTLSTSCLEEFFDHLRWNWKQRARGSSRRMCCARYENTYDTRGAINHLSVGVVAVIWNQGCVDLIVDHFGELICQEDWLQHHGNITIVIHYLVGVYIVLYRFSISAWEMNCVLGGCLFLDPLSETLLKSV